jgi:ribosomal protein S18 acetylase RimI-like enzyme
MVVARLRLRPATDDDLPALVDALRQEELFVDRLKRQAEGRGTLLAAWQSGKIVGVVYLWYEPADEPEVRQRLRGVPLIRNLEVPPANRNRGVGTRILAEAENVLRRRGYRRVALGVTEDNAGAIRLYLRHGYRPWSFDTVRTDDEEYQIFVKHLE